MRYPEATWIPSPNFGYPRGTHGQLKAKIDEAGKSGEFWHSQVGRQSVSIAMFQNPATEVSAHFLFPKVGRPVQMVDSNDPAWHAGGFIANVYYHGFEFEGGAFGNLSEPLTTNQIAWGVKVTRWLRQVHKTPTRYVRRDTLWEHNEVKATACPSNRIPWAKVIAALEDDEMKLLHAKPSGRIYTVGAGGKRHIGPTEWKAWKAMGYTLQVVADADIAKLPTFNGLVAKTPFKPTGHPGAALKTWITSYDGHRKTATGRQNHTVVKKHMDDAAKHSGGSSPVKHKHPYSGETGEA